MGGWRIPPFFLTRRIRGEHLGRPAPRPLLTSRLGKLSASRLHKSVPGQSSDSLNTRAQAQLFRPYGGGDGRPAAPAASPADGAALPAADVALPGLVASLAGRLNIISLTPARPCAAWLYVYLLSPRQRKRLTSYG